MEDQNISTNDDFVPAVYPEKLTEGKIFWVETRDGAMLNIGNVESLKIQGPPWVIEATTTGSETITLGEYSDEQTAKIALRYLVTDSQRHSAGQTRLDAGLGEDRTRDGKYNEENVLARHRIATTPLPGE